MDNNPPQQKKGLGPLAWIGIGCGGIIVLGIVTIVVLTMVYGKDLKNMATEMQQEMQTNPTRATASLMVKVSGGKFEFVAEDDINKRYTLKEKSNGTLMTVYWSEKTQKPETVQGDFTAIPADATKPASDAAPAPSPAPQQ